MGRVRDVIGGMVVDTRELVREEAGVVAGRRQSMTAGLVILLVVPVAAAAGAKNPVLTYLGVLGGAVVVAAVILSAFVLLRRLWVQRP